VGPHLVKAQSATSDLSSLKVLGLRHFVPKPLIQGLSRCGKCPRAFPVSHPSPFAGSPAAFSNQRWKFQAEVHSGVTCAGYLFGDACSLEALVIRWILAGSSLCLSGSTTPAVSLWFPYLGLDFGQRPVLQTPRQGRAVYGDDCPLGPVQS